MNIIEAIQSIRKYASVLLTKALMRLLIQVDRYKIEFFYNIKNKLFLFKKKIIINPLSKK